jgi:hypothetical protein
MLTYGTSTILYHSNDKHKMMIGCLAPKSRPSMTNSFQMCVYVYIIYIINNAISTFVKDNALYSNLDHN